MIVVVLKMKLDIDLPGVSPSVVVGQASSFDESEIRIGFEDECGNRIDVEYEGRNRIDVEDRTEPDSYRLKRFGQVGPFKCIRPLGQVGQIGPVVQRCFPWRHHRKKSNFFVRKMLNSNSFRFIN